MSMSRELKDFVASFNAGYKLWDDTEYKKALMSYYKSGHGKGAASLGEDDLVKYGYDPSLSGADKGISMAAARFRAAQERGDAADIKAQAENTIAVKRLNEAPAAALPQAKPNAPVKVKPQQTSENEDDGQNQNQNVQVADNDQPDSALPVDTQFSAAGGMIQRRYAEGGGPMDDDSSPTAATRQYDQAKAQGALPEPTAAPSAPASDDSGFFSGLVQKAKQGVTLGAEAIKDELTPKSAVPDEGQKQKMADFAASKGRLNPDELKAIDATIDPKGLLPDEYRPVARMAAVLNYANQNPEQGKEMAKRLLMTDKFESQTRGVLALRALNDGNYPEAVKLIQDAYNSNNYDGRALKTSINEDGSVKAEFLQNNEVVDTKDVPKDQLIQIAGNFANNDEFFSHVMGIVNEGRKMDAEAKAAKKGGGGGGRGGSGVPGGDDFYAKIDKLEEVEGQRRTAQDNLEKAKTDDEKAKAQSVLDDLTKQRDQLKKDAYATGLEARGKNRDVVEHRNKVRKAIDDTIKGAEPVPLPEQKPQAQAPAQAVPVPPARPAEFGQQPGQTPPQPQAPANPRSASTPIPAMAAAAGGQNWTPKDATDLQALQGQLAQTQQQIQGIQSRTHPSMQGAPNAQLDQLQSQAQDIQNRINSFDPKTGVFLKATDALRANVPLDKVLQRMKESNVPQDVIDAVSRFANGSK